MRIGVGVPNGDNFMSEFVSTLTMIIYLIGTKGHEFLYFSSSCCYVDLNRQMIWDMAVKNKCDYLLFLDTDVQYVGRHNDILAHMISLNSDVVSGAYYSGNYPHRPIVYDLTIDGEVMHQLDGIPDKPEYWDAAGGGFLLISKKVMDAFTPEVTEKYGKPWDFYFKGTKLIYREDVAFCWRLKQLGFRVLVDPEIKLNHLKKQPIGEQHFLMAKEQLAKQAA
jgi:GT2 family glycosyltransferase